MGDIKTVALGIMLGWEDMDAGEEGGNNSGPFVRRLLANVDPPINIAAAWCAAAIQGAWDVAARKLQISNPLDEVRREALVADYYERFQGYVVAPDEAEIGDLILYQFHGAGRWNHIGQLVVPPGIGRDFIDVSGNTGDDDPRDGDGVESKERGLDRGYPVLFINPMRIAA